MYNVKKLIICTSIHSVYEVESMYIWTGLNMRGFLTNKCNKSKSICP